MDMSSYTNAASLLGSEEIAYNALKTGILNGKLLPGTRLVIRNLAKEIGISPTPIRLALRMLERDGLVVNVPELGASVRQWSKQEIIDLSLIRKYQDGLACQLCAERATRFDMASIEEFHETFVSSAMASDVETNLQADISFHIAIVRGAHCPDLERFVENLAIMQIWIRPLWISLHIPPLVDPSMKDAHDEIIEALRKRDGKAAELAGQRHVEVSLDIYLKAIEEYSGQGQYASSTSDRSGIERRLGISSSLVS